MANVSLATHGLTKRYGALVAVDGLDLEVYEGEVFGFLGPNGAGKTTSINMMCGLLAADAGETRIFGQAITRSDASARARVGVCPQQVVLWPRLTCLEQLEFMGEMYDLPRRKARARGEALLEAMGLHDKRHRLARTLSGGMQRRLSVVLALVHDPDVVVLDEPEAGLDPQSRVLMRETIEDLARRQHKTVVFTTHNMDEAERVVDRVAILDHGKLLVVDTPSALKQRIGRGDTLRIGLGGGAVLPEPTRTTLREVFPGAEVAEDGILLRELAIVDRLPAILQALGALGLTPDRIELRESSLEDVFITLTGRSLRE